MSTENATATLDEETLSHLYQVTISQQTARTLLDRARSTPVNREGHGLHRE